MGFFDDEVRNSFDDALCDAGLDVNGIIKPAVFGS